MLQGEKNKGQNETRDRQVLIELTEQPQALSEQETEATHQLDIPLEVPKSSSLNQEFMHGATRG